MGIYKYLYNNIIYPGYHSFKRDGLLEAEKEAKYAEKLSNLQLLNYQKKKIENLLRFSFDNVPYYRNKLIRAGISNKNDIISDNLYDLPVLSKGEITTHFDSFQSANLAGNTIFKNSTSGSSGQPFKFNTDLKSFYIFLVMLRQCFQ